MMILFATAFFFLGSAAHSLSHGMLVYWGIVKCTLALEVGVAVFDILIFLGCYLFLEKASK